MPTSLAFDRQKSSDPANFPQEHGPLSRASGWKSPADTGCLADKIDSWMRRSWAFKERANPPGLPGYPAVSESFFPICAKRTIRFRGNSVPLPPVSGTLEDEFHTQEVHSKRPSKGPTMEAAPAGLRCLSSLLALPCLYAQAHAGIAFCSWHRHFQQQLLLYLPPVEAGSFLVKLQLLFMHFTRLPMERGGLSDRGQGSHS